MAYQPGDSKTPIVTAPQSALSPPGYEDAKIPEQIPGVPIGLEHLSQIDQLYIKQNIKILDSIPCVKNCCKSSDSYKARNNQNQNVYDIAEESQFFNRLCCRSNRGFKLTLTDTINRNVIVCERDNNCNNSILVTSPITRETFGYIKKNFKCCIFNTASFSIQDANQVEIFSLEGVANSFLTCSCCKNLEYQLCDLNGTQCGSIIKQYTTCLKESCTNANNFDTTFPIDLDVKLKAVVACATFLLDMHYFS